MLIECKGPVVRVGPNELSFADPAAVRDIYSSDKFIKDESFYVSHGTEYVLQGN
jgi:hypothetical protein